MAVPIRPAPKIAVGNEEEHSICRILRFPADVARESNSYSQEDLQTLIMKTSKDQIDAALEPTLEYARISCLGGKTCNGDGSTAIDWDTLLGKTRPVCTVASTFDEENVNEWMDIIQKAAGGMPYEETIALCGTNFWAKLLTNPKFRESRNYWQMGQGQRTAYWEQVGEITQVSWSGIRFLKYPAYQFGTEGLAFPADKAYIVPAGIPGKFMTQYAIGDFNELTPEDIGLKYHAKLEPNEFGRGMKIYLQSNTLIYDAFPETTIEVSLKASQNYRKQYQPKRQNAEKSASGISSDAVEDFEKCSYVAFRSPRNNGCGLFGRLLNSG